MHNTPKQKDLIGLDQPPLPALPSHLIKKYSRQKLQKKNNNLPLPPTFLFKFVLNHPVNKRPQRLLRQMKKKLKINICQNPHVPTLPEFFKFACIIPPSCLTLTFEKKVIRAGVIEKKNLP